MDKRVKFLLDPQRFRHFSISDPRFESESIRNFVVYSEALQRRGEFSLWVPETRTTEDLPIVVLLHGVYGTHWSWFMQGGAHRIMARMIATGKVSPMALLCPSDGLIGEGSGYLPLREGNCEAWILECVEITALIHGGRGQAFIAGLSMGGFGALRIGARHSDVFAAVSAHSPITRIEEFAGFLASDHYGVLASQTDSTADVLASMLSARGKMPYLRFDCGREDTLMEGCRSLHADLSEAGIEHTFEELAGAHDWAYWQTNLPRSLEFFERVHRAAKSTKQGDETALSSV